MIAVIALGTLGLAQEVVPDRSPHLPDTPYRYAADLQLRGAAEDDNTPADNPITDDGATLGRVLFYDPLLSANNTTACGSCHVQSHAFADPNRLSRGFAGGLTDRHAMNLTNLRYYRRARFFWDERGGNLEDTVLLPIANRLEMGERVAGLPQKLARTSYYPELFRRAFADTTITEQRVAKALAQFLRSLVSTDSRYDQGLARAGSAALRFDNFSRQENHGKALFLRHCANCHKSGDAHFFVLVPTNNGIDVTDADGGIGDITLNSIDQGRFKSPSLRNVEVAGPYMHDGRLSSLEAVVDHYSRGFAMNRNVDPRMRHLNFTDSEKAALVAFLKTLTDSRFLADPRFSDPFGRSAAVISGPAPPAPQAVPVSLSVTRGTPVDEIVRRVLSFDANKDGRVATGELNERMQPLIAAGDINGDGGLDATEIAAYSKSASPLSFGAVRGQRVMKSLVVSLTSPDETLAALLDDLDLPIERRQRARQALAGARTADAAVLKRLEAILTAEELADVAAASDRLDRKN